MILYCANCGAALQYNPSVGMMECKKCCSFFPANQTEPTTEKLVSRTVPNTTNTMGTASASSNTASQYTATAETMECNIYSCTACGAELAINGVESSTFCAYCGQPTIVFNRVSSELKPKYIIPFSVSKEQAVTSIRKWLNQGVFVPDEIKNFNIERMRGIYIPFWLYDIHYYDKLYLSGTVGSGKHKRTKYFMREAECDFNDITLDASSQLSDETSQRLEPYDTRALQPFDINYLSGFYADRYDMKPEQLNDLAINRAKDLFNKEVKNTISASNIQILKWQPKRTIKRTDYALFPAWFLTFRYHNEPHTILVNGQTGKVIGAVPYNKTKVSICFVTIGIIASSIATLISMGILSSDSDEKVKGIMILLFIALIMFFTGKGAFLHIKKSIELTKASATNRFVKDRQEGM